MDDRRRVPIPPRFRGAFDGGVFLTAGSGDWVEIVPPEAFERLKALAEAWPETTQGSQARAAFYSLSREDRKDGQGRVTLTDELVAYAGLSTERKVVVVGAGDRLQVWDSDRWQAGEADRRAAREAVMNAAAAARSAAGAA